MISNVMVPLQYLTNGVRVNFPYDCKIFDPADLEVHLLDAVNQESLAVLNQDYTVTGAGNESGGAVVFTTPPPTSQTLTIRRVLPLVQTNDYVENDAFPAEAHENALDKIIMILQEQAARSLHLPPSFLMPLQLQAPVPNTVLSWDSLGTSVINRSVETITVPEIDFIGNYQGSLTQAIIEIGAGAKTLLVNQGITLVADLAVPENIQLWVNREGRITVDGCVLTINGTAPGGLTHIFNCINGGRVEFGHRIASTFPEWWGAIPDGFTDCTTAIRAGLTTGKKVRLSLGTYRITDECGLIADNQSLVGEGPGSIIYNTTTNKNSIVIAPALNNILISNFAILGDASATGDITKAAIHVTSGVAPRSNVTISKLWIKNVNGVGMALAEIDGLIISDVFIESSFDHNMYISVCRGVLIDNVYLKDGSARYAGGGQCLKIKNSRDVFVSNSRCIDGSNSGISIEGDGTGPVSNIHLTNVESSVSKAGSIALQIGSIQAPVTGITVTGGKYSTVAGCNAPISLNGLAAGGNIPTNVQFNGVTASSPDYNAVYGNFGDNIRFNGGYYEGVAGGYAIQTVSTSGVWSFNGVGTGGGGGIDHQGTKLIASGCNHGGVGDPFAFGAATIALINGCFGANGELINLSLPTNRTASLTLYAKDSGRTFTNLGATGTINFPLPPATPGLCYNFSKQAAYDLHITPSGAELIMGGTAGQYINLETVADFLTLICYTPGVWDYGPGGFWGDTPTYH